MSKKERRWTLFVDESGNFADPLDPISVAGLLISEAVPGFTPAQIRQTLEKAVPGFPWPLHASFLNQPAYVAIAAYQREPAALDSIRPGLAAIVRAAVSIWESQALDALTEVTLALKTGRKPIVATLVRLTDALRRERPATLDGLVDVSREGWRAVNAVADQLLAMRHRDGRPIAYFVAASETACGDAGQSDSERYFEVLKIAIDRAAAILERDPDHHRLALNVQQRFIYDHRFKKQTMLMPQHVSMAVKELVPRHARVHFVATETPPYGTDATVEYVLADFLANRSRRILDDAQTALATIEERLGKYFGAPLRSGDPVRSHLAASGEAWQVVSSAMSGTQEELLERQSSRRRWACEQAFQWAAGAA